MAISSVQFRRACGWCDKLFEAGEDRLAVTGYRCRVSHCGGGSWDPHTKTPRPPETRGRGVLKAR